MRPIVAPGHIPLASLDSPCDNATADHGTGPNHARNDPTEFPTMADGNSPRILPDLSAQLAQMQAMIAAQAAEISRLSAARAANHKLRISEKGCVTLTGINGKWGVSFYATQWETILSKRDEILAFIAAHPELPRKTAD